MFNIPFPHLRLLMCCGWLQGLQDVCRSPAVHGALQSLLGKGYMLHPHGGFHAKPAGSGGQSFHKDGFFPGNGHGLR